MKEYKISKFWKFIVYSFATFFIVGFGKVALRPVFLGNFLSLKDWFLIISYIIIFFIAVLAVIDVQKSKLIIQKNSIELINIFSKNKLEFKCIKGYTVDKDYINVVPINEFFKTIKISKFFKNFNEILAILSQNFQYLEILQKKIEEEEILYNENFGPTKEIRGRNLLKAKKISKTINWAAALSAFWAFIYPFPYVYALFANILIPLFALFVIIKMDGLIHIEDRENSVYPNQVNAFVFPSLALIYRVLADYNILYYSNLLWSVILITVTIFFILFSIKYKVIVNNKQNNFLFIILLFFFFIYSYGTVVFINCYFDNSTPKIFTAKVKNKLINKGNTNLYYLQLSAREYPTDNVDIKVKKALFNKIKVNEKIQVVVKSGKLNIPWMYVVLK